MTQFGILLPRAPSSAPERWFDHLVDMTTGAEETGFRSVWVDDPPVAAPGGLEAVTLLGGLGARTSTVRLGMLAALSCRPAGILAKMVTTLDVITRGRVELGLGLVPGVRADGSRPGEAEPAEEVGEAVVVCRALFTGDDVSFTGHHNRLEHARNLPPPVQPGGPTLMVGGLPTPTTSSHADRLGCRLGVDRVGPFVDLVRRSGGS
jgi:alkanesulfonate monooxygenase SsuD/methylene tetrahydromethanopterin reductase-like flavin-dependent oxidoreductase (luciferase family)